jgi:hypothetical protein
MLRCTNNAPCERGPAVSGLSGIGNPLSELDPHVMNTDLDKYRSAISARSAGGRALPAARVPAASCAALAALLLGSGAARGADEPLGFTFGPTETVTYDTNVFRLPSGTPAPGVVHDTSANTGLTASLHEVYGREDVSAAASVGRVLYRQSKQLNYTQEDLRGAVTATLPQNIDAAVSLSHTSALANYANIISNLRDVITRNDATGHVDMPVLYDFRVLVGGEAAQSRNSATAFKTQDFNTAEINGGFRYQPTTGNYVDLLVRSVNGTYVNGSPTVFVGPGYRDHDIDLSADWTFSGASHLHGRAGYIKHNHDDYFYPERDANGNVIAQQGRPPTLIEVNRDFSGPAYDLSYLWQLTALTGLKLYGLRTTGAAGDNSYQSAVTHTYRVTPSYQLSAKTQVNAYAEWSRQDFFVYVLPTTQPGVGQVSSTRRLDHAHRVGLSTVWNPRRWLQATLDVHHEVRDSTDPAGAYTDTVAQLQLQGNF